MCPEIPNTRKLHCQEPSNLVILKKKRDQIASNQKCYILGNAAIVKILIQHNVDVNKGFNGDRLTTPLMYSIYKGKQ